MEKTFSNLFRKTSDGFSNSGSPREHRKEHSGTEGTRLCHLLSFVVICCHFVVTFLLRISWALCARPWAAWDGPNGWRPAQWPPGADTTVFYGKPRRAKTIVNLEGLLSM